MMKTKKPALLLTLGAAIVLILGGAIGYWLTSQRRLTADLPVGSDVVPQDALLTLTFSTDNGQWRRLREFGTAESQAILDRNLAQLRDRLLTANGFNYQQDIQPWIGQEFTVAFLSPSAESTEPDAEQNPDAETEPEPETSPQARVSPAPDANPQANAATLVQAIEPDLELESATENQQAVLVLPIEDPVRAQEILSRNGQNTASEQNYRGLSIYEFTNENDETYTATVLSDRFLVISADESAVEQVIDTYRGEASVARTPGYADAFQQVVAAQPFLRVYVNVPAARTLAASNSAQPVPPQSLAPLHNSQGMAATVSIESDQIQIQGLTWLASDSQTRYTNSNKTLRSPNLLPAETLMMASGGNLQQLWKDYSQRAAGTSSMFSPDSLQQGLRSFTGLSLQEDFIPWMDGEFALSLIPTAQSDSDPGIGILFMVQASDRDQAEETLQALDEVMSDRYSFQTNTAEIEGTPVVNWVSPFGGVTVTHGWLDDDVLFMGFGGSAVIESILPSPQRTLAEADLFRRSNSTNLSANSGRFFVDMSRLANGNNNVPLPSLPPQGEAFVSAIQAIGVTGSIQDDRRARYDISILLQKAGNPKPLPPPSSDADASPDSE